MTKRKKISDETMYATLNRLLYWYAYIRGYKSALYDTDPEIDPDFYESKVDQMFDFVQEDIKQKLKLSQSEINSMVRGIEKAEYHDRKLVIKKVAMHLDNKKELV